MGNDSSHLTSLHMCTWEMIPHTSPACTCVHGMVMVVAWPYTQVVNSYQDSTHKTTLTTNQYLSLSSSPSSPAVCCQLHLSGPTLQSGHHQGRNTAGTLYKIPSHHVTNEITTWMQVKHASYSSRRRRQTGECTANGGEGKPCVLVQGGASSSQQEVTAISCVGTVTGNGETMSSGQSDTLILSCWSM